jgi:hypothetical protein
MLRGEMGVPERHPEVTVPQNFFHFLERAPSHDEVTRRGMPKIVKATVENPGAFAGGLKGGAHLSPRRTVAGFEERAHALRGEWGQVREDLDTDAIERDTARLPVFRVMQFRSGVEPKITRQIDVLPRQRQNPGTVYSCLVLAREFEASATRALSETAPYDRFSTPAWMDLCWPSVQWTSRTPEATMRAAFRSGMSLGR